MSSTTQKRRRSRKGQPAWLPQNYTMRDGMIYCDPRDRDEPDIRVCTAFRPTALLRDARGEGWSVLLEFADQDGNRRAASVRLSRLHGKGSEIRSELTEAGMMIELAARDHPFDRLLTRFDKSAVPRGTVVERPGWSGDTFVAPGGSSVSGNGEQIVHYPGALPNQTQGSAEAQVEAVRAAFEAASAGKSDLYALAALAGAAGCLVDRAELDSTPIAALTGASSKGKTSAAMFGASMFGDPETGKAGLQPLRGTTNAFELIAERRTGAALFLDEPGGANHRQFDLPELVFMLAGGCGKPRNKHGDSSRRTPSWRTFAFITAEFSVRQLAEQGRGTVSAGYAVRAVDIDVTDAERLSEATFSRLMNVRRNYGHIGPIIAKQLSGTPPENLRNAVEERARLLAGAGADGMMVRAASVLAVLWVTGTAFEGAGVITAGATEPIIVRTWKKFIASEAASGLNPEQVAAETLKQALFSRLNADVRPRLDGFIDEAERRSGAAVAYYEHSEGVTTFYVPVPSLLKLADTSLKSKVLVGHLLAAGVMDRAGERNVAFSEISKALPIRHYRLRYAAGDTASNSTSGAEAVAGSNIINAQHQFSKPKLDDAFIGSGRIA